MSKIPADGPVPVSAAESERSKFRKHFGRFDILFFLLCTIVGVDTIGTVASSGAEAFTWLIVLAVVFFVPSALLTAELGTAFAEEGGPYIWTSRAFGRLAGAVNNFLYWVTNPVWLGGTLSVSAVTAFTTFFNDGKDLSTPAFYVFTLLFVWVGVLAAILSFDIGKWIPTAGPGPDSCCSGSSHSPWPSTASNTACTDSASATSPRPMPDLSAWSPS
jgi:amino acid transporter